MKHGNQFTKYLHLKDVDFETGEPTAIGQGDLEWNELFPIFNMYDVEWVIVENGPSGVLQSRWLPGCSGLDQLPQGSLSEPRLDVEFSYIWGRTVHKNRILCFQGGLLAGSLSFLCRLHPSLGHAILGIGRLRRRIGSSEQKGERRRCAMRRQDGFWKNVLAGLLMGIGCVLPGVSGRGDGGQLWALPAHAGRGAGHFHDTRRKLVFLAPLAVGGAAGLLLGARGLGAAMRPV